MLWVALLLLAVVFIYAIIGFAVFPDQFNDPESNSYCQNLRECFVTVLRFGLIGGDFLVIFAQQFFFNLIVPL